MFSERILWSFPVKSLLGPTENLPQQTVRTFKCFCRNSPWQPQNKSNKVWAPHWAFSSLCDDCNILSPLDRNSKSVRHCGSCINRPFASSLFAQHYDVLKGANWCLSIVLLCSCYATNPLRFSLCFCWTIKYHSKWSVCGAVAEKWETQALHSNAINIISLFVRLSEKVGNAKLAFRIILPKSIWTSFLHQLLCVNLVQ